MDLTDRGSYPTSFLNIHGTALRQLLMPSEGFLSPGASAGRPRARESPQTGRMADRGEKRPCLPMPMAAGRVVQGRYGLTK